MNSVKSPNIVIAGASGYIGQSLIPSLLEKFPQAKITALSRTVQPSTDERVVWKACDLFSLTSIEGALPQQVDLAIYLVHSMGPTAQLDQGSFADYDLLLADNFARSISKAGLSQLIYLGGLIPEKENLSLHLQSRLEVEQSFAQYKLPMTIFRAGLILGAGGSSFQILIKLVKRLPIMICPKWTQTLTTPVDLKSVLSAITTASLEPSHIGKIYDLAGCQPLTYLQMMKETSRCMGLKRYFLTIPYFTPTLSRLWVRLVTNTSKDLVYPLIESLEHPMVARPTHIFSNEGINKTYFDLLESVSLRVQPGRPIFRFSVQRKTVRSVQRFDLPAGWDAKKIKDQYIEWLPRYLSPFIRSDSDSAIMRMSFLSQKLKLLELKLNLERSDNDRQLLAITDGLLVSKENRGRLEFRVVLNRRFVLTEIHEYRPALHWFVYKYTQAIAHLIVMTAFARHLKSRS